MIVMKKVTMQEVVISGVGVHLPEHVVSTEELVGSYNAYVARHNRQHAKEIAAGSKAPLIESNVEFIIQMSGVKARRMIDKKNVLACETMRPVFSLQDNAPYSLQCQLAIPAAREALADANKTPADIDMILVSACHLQRHYPAIAIELQSALGVNKGFAYDMNAACSSASYAIASAYSFIHSGLAQCVLVVNPEIFTCNINFRDRKTHFIFGDGCSALVVEKKDRCQKQDAYQILDIKLQSQFSNSIQSNFGYINRYIDGLTNQEEAQYFTQNGRVVAEEVVQLASHHILDHLEVHSIELAKLKRLWLHQANINMNVQIAKNVFNREVAADEIPTVLTEYGNTGSSGAIIAFHHHHRDLKPKDIGVLCSYGAGYTVGSVILEKI